MDYRFPCLVCIKGQTWGYLLLLLPHCSSACSESSHGFQILRCQEGLLSRDVTCFSSSSQSPNLKKWQPRLHLILLFMYFTRQIRGSHRGCCSISLSWCCCSFTQTSSCLADTSASDAFLSAHYSGQATTATAANNQHLCINLKTAQFSSKALTAFRVFLYSHGGPHSSNRHGTPYYTDDCCPGISPADTANPDGSAFVACLTTHSKNDATMDLVHSHTNTRHRGKNNSMRNSMSSIHAPLSDFSDLVSCPATHSQDHARTLPNASLVLVYPCLASPGEM